MPRDPNFFRTIQHIQDVIARFPDPRTALPLLTEALRDTDIQRVFLKTLETPDWILPLKEAGCFHLWLKEEPAAQAGAHGVLLAASEYLARMADQAPDEVADVLVNTDVSNMFVTGNVLHAASKMPPRVATKLVPTLCRAAKEGTLSIHTGEASDLCVHLANANEVSSAMVLADAVFAPRFGNEEERLGHQDKYLYRQGLEKALPSLTMKLSEQFVRRLCGWLVLSIEAKGHAGQASGWDGSYMWRPAIEEHAQNFDYDFAGIMAGFVREAFELAIQQNRLTLVDSLQILDQYRYLVFKRIHLHLINAFAEQEPGLARETMMSHELFDSYQHKHEYAMLMGRRFSILTTEEQAEWLGWVDAGPDMSNYDESFRRHQGRDPTDDDRRARVEYWQFTKLYWIRDHLEGKRKVFYDRMLAEQGFPELADLNVHSGLDSTGYRSPIDIEELKRATFAEAVDRVTTWRPDKTVKAEFDVEGLSSAFEQYVGTKPEEFSRQAEAMIRRPAVFVRIFISKMAEAIKEGLAIDVLAVLRLSKWVVEQPLDQEAEDADEEVPLVDRNWQWSREEISRLVQAVCNASDNEKPRYPLEPFRAAMWPVLNPLTSDPPKSYIGRDPAQEDLRVHDYLDMGINSPRGKAVDALLAYARWIANHTKEVQGRDEIVPNGFDGIPEVRTVLNWQVTPDNATLEVMSVIGAHIGLLFWIDKKWLAANTDRIFNLRLFEEEPAKAYGWAAWNAFLVWRHPHIDFYHLFKSQFAYAAAQAERVTLPERSRTQPMFRLGEHLILLYGRGQLGLDDDNALIRRFLTQAVPEIRRHTISFVGESLKHDKKVPDQVIKRFMELWDWYWGACGRSDAQTQSEDWMFGQWFACGQFPSDWSLDRLQQFVEVVPMPGPDHEIARHLAAIADTDIKKSVHILDRIIRADQQGWRLHDWLETAKKILPLALREGGGVAHEASQLIDYLGRRGYTEFGELLKA